VDRLAFYVDGQLAASAALPGPLLAVPQAILEDALLSELRASGVELRTPHQAATLEQSAEHVDVRIMRRELVTLGSPAHYSEWEPVESTLLRADFVIGSDGYESRVRAAAGLEIVDVDHTETFAMFEAGGVSGLGSEATLSFGEELAGLVYPLRNERARIGFQIADGLDAAPDLERLRRLLSTRAPWFGGAVERVEWGTVMHFERRVARRFGRGRVWLAGDAAHVTSPLGAQSMNVGLYEAFQLVEHIADCIKSGAAPACLEHYAAEREREWHKLLGVNVRFDVLPHAPPWVSTHARRLVPALPASGADLAAILEQLGLRLS
jgi:2-polyprenyl-6-methoxyphenol hydroxylase-like FAD-dependent oxidoreductase